MKRTTKDILNDATQTLNTAKYGLEDLIKGNTDRKFFGLRNLVVFCRAVTNVLQNLRSTESGFDQWYQPYVDEMRDDALLKFFYKLRTEILKKGSLPTTASMYIKQLRFPRDINRFGPPPPNAKGFFIGDQLGGSGWEVELSDGSIEKYYVDLPSEIASVNVFFANSPKTHLGIVLENLTIEELAQSYFNYIKSMVDDAFKIFGGRS